MRRDDWGAVVVLAGALVLVAWLVLWARAQGR